MNRYKILLASKSPRRRELMQMLRVPFTVISIGNISEEYPADMPVLEVPEYLSQQKAEVYRNHINDDELVITADTVVVCDGKIFGKPGNGAEAVKMLHSLSGKTHQVATGVTLATRNKIKSFTTITDVTFTDLEDSDIDYYVENYQPMDKAGAYGIQEWIGCVAVSSINGSFYNVMGLPVHRLYRELKEFTKSENPTQK